MSKRLVIALCLSSVMSLTVVVSCFAEVVALSPWEIRVESPLASGQPACTAKAQFAQLPTDYFWPETNIAFQLQANGAAQFQMEWTQPLPPWLSSDLTRQIEQSSAPSFQQTGLIWFDKGPSIISPSRTYGELAKTDYDLRGAGNLIDILSRSSRLHIGSSEPTTQDSLLSDSSHRNSKLTVKIDQGAALALVMRKCVTALREKRPFAAARVGTANGTHIIEKEEIDTRPILVKLKEAQGALRVAQTHRAAPDRTTKSLIRVGTLAANALRLGEARDALMAVANTVDQNTPQTPEIGEALARLMEVLLVREEFEDAQRIAKKLPNPGLWYAAVELRRGDYKPAETRLLKLISTELSKSVQDFNQVTFVASQGHVAPSSEQLAALRLAFIQWAMARLGEENMVAAARSDSYSQAYFSDVPAFAVAEQVFRWIDLAMIRIDAKPNVRFARDLGQAAYLRAESLRRAGLLRSVDTDLRYAHYELERAGDEGSVALTDISHAALLADLGLRTEARKEARTMLAALEQNLGQQSIAWLEAAWLLSGFQMEDGELENARTLSLAALAEANRSLPRGHSLTVRLCVRTVEAALAGPMPLEAGDMLVRVFGLQHLPDISDEAKATLQRTLSTMAQEQTRSAREKRAMPRVRSSEELEAEAQARDLFSETARKSGLNLLPTYKQETDKLRGEARAAATREAQQSVAPDNIPEEKIVSALASALEIPPAALNESALARVQWSELNRLANKCLRMETSKTKRNALIVLTHYLTMAEIVALKRGVVLDFNSPASGAEGYRTHLRQYARSDGSLIGKMDRELAESLKTLGLYFTAMKTLSLPSLLPSDYRPSLRKGGELEGLEVLLQQLQATPVGSKEFDASVDFGLLAIQAATRGDVQAELVTRTMLDPAPHETAEIKDITASRRTVQGESWLRRERALLRDRMSNPAKIVDEPSTNSEVRRQYLSITYSQRAVSSTFQTALGNDLLSIASGSSKGLENMLHGTTHKYVVGAKALQSRLKSNEAVVIWLPLGHSLHIVVVKNDRVRWIRTDDHGSSINEKVAAIRQSITNASDITVGRVDTTQFAAEQAHALYRVLFGPIESELADVTHLYTVQLGETGGLPLALLLSKMPAMNASWTWLGERFAITRMPGLINPAVLDGRPQTSNKSARSFLGIGAPTRAAIPKAHPSVVSVRDRLTASLDPLTNAGQEMRSISRRLDENGSSSLILAGAEATRAAVLKQLRDSNQKVIMFATHGFVGSESQGVGEPALLLSANPEDASGDGLLRASDIVALNLRADLVILSACSTAPSGEDGAEPLAGLASTFLIAGAHTVLATHWTLPTNDAVRLTENMVEGQFGQGLDPAFAMQESAGVLRRDASTSHPLYWAQFEVIGFPRAGP